MDTEKSEVSRMLSLADKSNQANNVSQQNQVTAEKPAEKPTASAPAANLLAEQITRKIEEKGRPPVAVREPMSMANAEDKAPVNLDNTSTLELGEDQMLEKPAPAPAPAPAQAPAAVVAASPSAAETEYQSDDASDQVVQPEAPKMRLEPDLDANTDLEVAEPRKTAFKPSAAVENAIKERMSAAEVMSAAALVEGKYLPRISMQLAEGSGYDEINKLVGAGALRIGIDGGRPAVILTKVAMQALLEAKQSNAAACKAEVEKTNAQIRELEATAASINARLTDEEAGVTMLSNLIEDQG